MLESRTQAPALRVLGVCLHLLMIGLLALAAVRALAAEPPAFAAVLAAAATGAIYAVGPLSTSVRESLRARALWLIALGVAWLALLALAPEGVWVAFPMFFVQLHLLPGRWGVLAVFGTAVAAIIGFGWHQHALNPGTVLGPLLGAAVAVGTVRGYQALHRESEHRKLLIEELLATRDELATAERSSGTLAERDRLAREIHDTLAQGLSSIQLLLRAAERALPAEPDTAGRHVRQARETAQDNLAEARRFVHALSPPDLAEGSLPSALARLCANTEASTRGLTVRFELTGTAAELPTQHEVTLLRIAQSALANTAQHARADNAVASLTYGAYGSTLRISDDGAGFGPLDATGDGGFGLASMRERAAALGGSCTVESEPGQGTTIAVSLPLAAAHEIGGSR